MDLIKEFNITPDTYQSVKPYPHMFMDNFLESGFAEEIQSEIMSLSDTSFDRYSNPFEQKYTLRDKYAYPPKLQKLMDILSSQEFVSKLSDLVGYQLVLDHTRNFWGVHKYESGDKLDIHVDAGTHPHNGLKKQVTLGIYLSYKWKDEYGCWLEVWNGSNAQSNNAFITDKVARIAPMFNRLVIFTCNDYSWHGNPEPVTKIDPDAIRIFVTLSYLSSNLSDLNKRQKAFFVARPQDPPNLEKDKLRLLRADPVKYKEVYRCN